MASACDVLEFGRRCSRVRLAVTGADTRVARAEHNTTTARTELGKEVTHTGGVVLRDRLCGMDKRLRW